jgi:steroid delta-isomerase-like uncharacterized protein
MSHDNAALVHRWFEEVWNQGREEIIDELFAPDGVTYGLGELDVEVRGPSQFKPFFRNILAAFPDLHITIQDTIAEGNKVAVRLLIEGTHKGAGLVGIRPSGRAVRLSGIAILHTSDGKLVAGWNNWDQLGMLQQIGVIAVPKTDRFMQA